MCISEYIYVCGMYMFVTRSCLVHKENVFIYIQSTCVYVYV